MKTLASWKRSYDQPRQHIKKQRHHFVDKGPYSQSCGFPGTHVWMWELDKEGWALKNRCFQTVVLEKTLENPLHSKMIKPVNPKGNQPWIVIGRTDADTEAPILWPPDAKSWLIRKDTGAGKEWRQEEKGMPEEKTVGWHHWRNGHEFEQTPGDGEGQGSLASCSPWGSQRVRHNWAAEQQQQPLEKLRLTDNKWLLHRHWISFTECMNHKKNLSKNTFLAPNISAVLPGFQVVVVT